MSSRWTAVGLTIGVVVTAVLVVVLRAAPVLGHGASAPPTAGPVDRTSPTPSASPSASPSAQSSGPTSAPPSASPSGTPSGTPSATPSARPAPPPPHNVLALGDSVPSGARCGCRPFPETYGALLAQHTGARVTVDNRAVSGLDSAGLVAQLRFPALQKSIRRADIDLITIGANDFNDHESEVVDGACEAGNSDCVSDELSSMGAHLSTVLARIRALRAGQPTSILVTGYWNVFQDGDVARRAFGTAGLQASLELTRRANAVIRSVATAAGARYVDIFTPFEDGGQNITSLLAWDGNHPDAAGHNLIARALLAAGLPRTS